MVTLRKLSHRKQTEFKLRKTSKMTATKLKKKVKPQRKSQRILKMSKGAPVTSRAQVKAASGQRKSPATSKKVNLPKRKYEKKPKPEEEGITFKKLGELLDAHGSKFRKIDRKVSAMGDIERAALKFAVKRLRKLTQKWYISLSSV